MPTTNANEGCVVGRGYLKRLEADNKALKGALEGLLKVSIPDDDNMAEAIKVAVTALAAANPGDGGGDGE